MALTRLVLHVPDTGSADRLFAGLLGGYRMDGDSAGSVTRQPGGTIVACRPTLQPHTRLVRLELEVDDPDGMADRVAARGDDVREVDGHPTFTPPELAVELVLAPPSGPARPPVSGPVGAAMAESFDHVCIAVRDLRSSVHLLRDHLGGEVVFGGHNRHIGTLSSQVRLGTGARVELLQPAHSDAPIATYLDRFGGPCMHHLTWRVIDVAHAVDAAERAGFEVTGTDLYSRDHWRETYLRPGATMGMLVQLAWSDRHHDDALDDDRVDAILAGRVSSNDYAMRIN